MDFQTTRAMILDNKVKFIDLRFTDTLGKWHHVSIPEHRFDLDLFELGHAFDGSSIAGWQNIECSDMLLKPDLKTAYIDNFYEEPTLSLICDVIDPSTLKAYDKCPRGIASRAQEYLVSSGIGDCAYFGPELEFFIFDSVSYHNDISGCSFSVNSEEAFWNISDNHGHRPSLKGGYFPLPPIDSLQDLRSEICLTLDAIGIPTEVHHHEVATAGQCEVGTKFSTLVKRADWSQIQKYVIKNIAKNFGKTATFMPKPLVGDNGSGMHVHQSIFKGTENLFAGNGYANLSDMALYYIGGIIKHAKAINAISNPSTNSYKRLVPGFEAPVMLAYSSRNRSASIRIPYVHNAKARRIEVRFPDCTANSYLAFSAMLLAGIDGIKNKIHPGDAMDINLYELDDAHSIPQVSSSLEESIASLLNDREFLLQGGVFSNSWIESYAELKMHEINKLRMSTHPIEFDMYFSS